MSIHAVLGSEGAIGQATTAALGDRGLEVRALRRPDADARDADALIHALEGASHVYHCVGLPYREAVWRVDFPKIGQALVEACAHTGARLVYFDNVYLYGPAPLPMPFDETTPRTPPSNKGRARKAALDIVTKAHEAGRIKLVVGRSADFYGPGAVNSPFYIRFLENMLAGKAPQVVMPKGPVHTYAYTLDMGRALVKLALDEGAYGEEWHLPVGSPVTVDAMAALFNAELGTAFKVSSLPEAMLRLLALFNPLLREVAEMNYQYRSDYVMADAKFRSRYPDFRTTPYAEGVAAMVRSFQG